jgi:hypothetical protein
MAVMTSSDPVRPERSHLPELLPVATPALWPKPQRFRRRT